VYARGRLAAGMAFAGPALVDQDDSTCLVAPGFRARVDHADNVLLARSHG
jgi:N-methylhydantoinase A